MVESASRTRRSGEHELTLRGLLDGLEKLTELGEGFAFDGSHFDPRHASLTPLVHRLDVIAHDEAVPVALEGAVMDRVSDARDTDSAPAEQIDNLAKRVGRFRRRGRRSAEHDRCLHRCLVLKARDME